MTVYKHGVYAQQLPTAIVPPRRVETALPVVVGMAPVHMVKDDYTGPVNKPTLLYSYQEAVETFGYSTDWANYTLCEFMYSNFALFAMAPVVFINVFDPATHKTAIAGEAQTFVDDKFTLDHPGLVADPVVKDQAGETTYAKGTDYTVDLITGQINRVATGTITAGETVQVDYSYGDPSKVTATEIIGGIDSGTGDKSGLELVNEVFPRYRMVPGQILAPGFSTNPEVAAIMSTKAANINNHFRAMAVVDVPSGAGGCTKYSDVPAWVNLNNYVDNVMINCWPKIKLESKEYWLSTQLAGLIAQVDAGNDDVPYESPSNKSLEMNGCLANDAEVFLGPEEANYLNSQGVVTALNFIGGWRAWGNRTGAYIAGTDVKDTFIPIQRMFNWVGNTFILTFWQKADKPITRRLVETIVDSFNIWLNGLAARQFILGGRVEFLPEENPATDLMDGIINFHIYLTPPSPAREITGLIEYDPGYLDTLFAA
jgi:phage tail sheath protein FI